jgi:lipopolysaccharide/colanic/teichoic acid biosynthesis glycosyltransferase
VTAKRLLDIVLSGIGLVFSSPLWAAIAAAIKFEDGGAVFYTQARVGERGRPFDALKFRSMIPDAERGMGPVQASERDPRVTRVGRMLRATAMDELPQLWNIFRGDMSFVGPRALRPDEIDAGTGGRSVSIQAIPGFTERCAVQPGLTGIAQIYAPRDVSRRQKFRLDLLYIRRRTFLLDLKLIFVSFWITMRGTWEARERKF